MIDTATRCYKNDFNEKTDFLEYKESAERLKYAKKRLKSSLELSDDLFRIIYHERGYRAEGKAKACLILSHAVIDALRLRDCKKRGALM